jgi:small-conductance mechanosensitive channel
MQTQSAHMTLQNPPAGRMSDVIGGLSQMSQGIAEYMRQLEAENNELRARLQESQQPPPNIVAPNKQNEWIAILSTLYDDKMIVDTCSKKDFMQRMADALGSPGIANYSAQLHKIKATYKYDTLLENVDKMKQKQTIKEDN